MILHTGGAAPGEISTKSNFASSAACWASLFETIPNGAPSGPTKRTSGAVISSLIVARFSFWLNFGLALLMFPFL